MPKPPEDLRELCASKGRVDVVLCVDAELAARIEQHRDKLAAKEGAPVSRTAAIRNLIIFALETLNRGSLPATESLCSACNQPVNGEPWILPVGPVCEACFRAVADEDEDELEPPSEETAEDDYEDTADDLQDG